MNKGKIMSFIKLVLKIIVTLQIFFFVLGFIFFLIGRKYDTTEIYDKSIILDNKENIEEIEVTLRDFPLKSDVKIDSVIKIYEFENFLNCVNIFNDEALARNRNGIKLTDKWYIKTKIKLSNKGAIYIDTGVMTNGVETYIISNDSLNRRPDESNQCSCYRKVILDELKL
ncbi:hypothetical protein [Flammeovirga sp. SJP92]|uniref:hypothetical protein n=1 Tax=Flammeovirga sp. SJP92 TaxID=1775430 RepID=UPI000786B0EB|nr:hypothetical protein [Flammeovirga sp. SJP92]KXX69477.1 hypothetical protein AVL50_16300 [Flammeovirga sp. SJP92]